MRAYCVRRSLWQRSSSLLLCLSRPNLPAHLARVKDVATIDGIRDNQLVGYGLVVGLRGTGDSSQTVFPAQTLLSTLERMGITVPQTRRQQRQQHAG